MIPMTEFQSEDFNNIYIYIYIYIFLKIEFLPFLVCLTFAGLSLFSVEFFRLNGVFFEVVRLPLTDCFSAELRRVLFERFVAINVCKSGFAVGDLFEMLLDGTIFFSEKKN